MHLTLLVSFDGPSWKEEKNNPTSFLAGAIPEDYSLSINFHRVQNRLLEINGKEIREGAQSWKKQDTESWYREKCTVFTTDMLQHTSIL